MTEEKRTAAAPIVLVVDQSELVRLFIVYALAAIGYAATAAKNVEEALQVLDDIPSLRVLICDLSLGPKSGPEFVRKALQNRPPLNVIFMAGHSENTAFRKTDPLLLKPFHLQQLRIAIETVLDEAHPRFEELGSRERRRSALFRTPSRPAQDNIAS